MLNTKTGFPASPLGASLLLRERFTKCCLGSVDVAEVAGPIDERVRRILGVGALAQLAVHVEEARV